MVESRENRSQAVLGLALARIIQLVSLLFAIWIVTTFALQGSLIRTVKSGNEGAAIGALRSLHRAQSRWFASDRELVGGASRYADSLAKLSATGVNLIDDELGSGAKQGYVFQVRVTASGAAWDAGAHAATPGTGQRRFYIDQRGELWFSGEDATDPVPLSGGTKGPPPGFRKLGE